MVCCFYSCRNVGRDTRNSVYFAIFPEEFPQYFFHEASVFAIDILI